VKRFIKTALFFAFLIALWQAVYLLKIFPPLLFPSLGTIIRSLFAQLASGELLVKTWYSLYLIAIGILISTVIAVFFAFLAGVSATARGILSSIVMLIDPLPGMALLPLAILWFGIGQAAIIFIVVHSVLWPIFLNLLSGFRSVPPILSEIGRNIGLSRTRLLTAVSIPASLPYILTGFRTGWSRAWRAVISAEMIFGAVGISGGLGWDIYMKRSFLDIPGLFATLVVIMAIGLVIENVFFRIIEKNTVSKWGMMT
jgi:NitT/TauT family transport system permease protein